jgi:hypothetical protein
MEGEYNKLLFFIYIKNNMATACVLSLEQDEHWNHSLESQSGHLCMPTIFVLL